MSFRIIPRLDIKAPNLVKGIHLEGLRILGKPAEFAFRYFQDGADELYYQDIVASLYNRNSIKELVHETAEQLFIPLTVGGGIRTLEDIHNLLRSGADKVCINTAAVARPDFIREAAQCFGCQCIVIAVETIRQPGGQWKAFTDNGRQHTGLNAYDWALKAVELGAGELLLTSVDREGTRKGLEIEFLEKVVSKVNVPVIAHGGTASSEDVVAAAQIGVAGVAIASLFHYDFLDIPSLKKALIERGIKVRT